MVLAAGGAALGYLLWRHRPAPTLTRRTSLDTLERDLHNWLPKLPFVPYLRLALNDGSGQLQLTSRGRSVEVMLREPAADRHDLAERFRSACRKLELAAYAGPDGPACRLADDPTSAARALTVMLRELHGSALDSSSFVVAVPGHA